MSRFERVRGGGLTFLALRDQRASTPVVTNASGRPASHGDGVALSLVSPLKSGAEAQAREQRDSRNVAAQRASGPAQVGDMRGMVRYVSSDAFSREFGYFPRAQRGWQIQAAPAAAKHAEAIPPTQGSEASRVSRLETGEGGRAGAWLTRSEARAPSVMLVEAPRMRTAAT